MRKGIISLFAIIVPFALVTFAQWTDTPKSEILYSHLVFFSPEESTFHKDTCKLLIGGRTAISVKDANDRGLKPCPECFPEAFPSSFIWAFSLEAPEGSNGLLYSDGLIDIAFVISRTQIGFIIQNKSAGGAKINWDDLSFISPINRASRVIHSGIRLVDRNNPQAPTTIPPGSSVTDNVIPSENIKYVDGWEQGRLFDGDYMLYNGKSFGLYFPMEINGKKKEYSFKFKISVTQVER